jgi:hypothetical protein
MINEVMAKTLDNYTKRMQFIAPIWRIAQEVTNNMIYNQYDMMNVTISTLCYLQYVTLTNDEGCYIEDVGDFIRDHLDIYYGERISEEDSVKMAYFIIRDVLQGKGTMIRADVLNPEKKTIETRTYELVQSNVNITKEDKRNLYKLTHQGMEILFRTDEVDGVMLMSLKLLILKKTLEGSNYDKALNQINELMKMAKMLYSMVEETINQAKIRIHEVNMKEVEQLQSRLNDQFNDQHETFNDLLKVVDDRKRKVSEELEYGEEKAIEEDILKLDGIKINLENVIGEYNKLLSIKQDIYKEIWEEYLSVSARSFDTGLDFHKIKAEFEKHTMRSEDILSLFKPLFKPYPKRRFNPAIIFSEQTRYRDTSLANEKEDNLIYDKELEDLVDVNEIYRVNTVYVNGMRIILDSLLETESLEITLREMIGKVKRADLKLYEDVILTRDFYEMILAITRGINPFDIEEHYKLAIDKNEEPSINFNSWVVLKEAITDETIFNKINRLGIEVLKNDLINIEDKFTISNLLFRGGVIDEH